MPPAPYCDESSDEDMKPESKGPNEKTLHDLPVPPTDPGEKCCLTYQSQQPLPNHQAR